MWSYKCPSKYSHLFGNLRYLKQGPSINIIVKWFQTFAYISIYICRTYSDHAACSWLKQSVKRIYSCIVCEYWTSKHTCVRKSMACACGKNYFWNLLHYFDAWDALWVLHTAVLCPAHAVQQSAVLGIPEPLIYDLSQVLYVPSYPGETLAVLYAFSHKWATHLELLPGSCCGTALCWADISWRWITCKSLSLRLESCILLRTLHNPYYRHLYTDHYFLNRS